MTILPLVNADTMAVIAGELLAGTSGQLYFFHGWKFIKVTCIILNIAERDTIKLIRNKKLLTGIFQISGF